MYLPTYIGAFIIAVAALAGWNWLSLPEENKIIDIMASREPDLALPVFAQFTVTQTLGLQKESRLHRLEVPIYFPSPDAGLDVTLRREQEILWRWRLEPSTEGVTAMALPLLAAEPVSGQLELTFSALQISHEDQAKAPRLFVESADEQYPHGYYRIAENVKQGDISLTVFERRTVQDRLLEGAARRPLKAAGQAGAGVLAVVMAASLPSVLARTVQFSSGPKKIREQSGER